MNSTSFLIYLIAISIAVNANKNIYIYILNTYRRHCRNTHNMTLDSIKPSAAFSGAETDINNTDFHCSKCDKILKTKHTLKRYLKVIH